MPATKKIQNSFTAGELDPKLRARSDVAAYYNGASKIRNAFVIPQGAAARRPGLEYVFVVPSTGNVQLIPFVFSTDDTYLIVVVAPIAYIYKNGVLQTLVGIGITDAQVAEVTWAQSYDTLILFHHDFNPKYLRRENDTTWTTGNWPLFNIPSYNFAGETTKEITITSSGGTKIPNFDDWSPGDSWPECEAHCTVDLWVAGDVGKIIKGGSGGIAVITAFVGVGQVKCTIHHEFAIDKDDKGIKLKAGEWSLEEHSISATRGYPACGTFFQGRLWLANTPAQPNSVWASKTNNETDFASWEPSLADSGIYITSGGGIMSSFHRMFGGKHLFILANTGEFYVPISNTEPVTPTNVSLVRSSSLGAQEGLDCFEIEGTQVFMRSGGKSLIQAKYNFVDGGYQNKDMALLSSHLLNTPVSMTYRKQSSADDSDYILVVNADGSLSVLCTLGAQEINAWSVCLTDGLFKAVGVDGITMYFIVERVIDGTTVRYLERFRNDLLLDSGVVVELDPEQTIVTGLEHLENMEVAIVLDNTVCEPQVVTGGQIELPRTGKIVDIGINFPIVDEDSESRVFIESMPIEYEGEWGTSVGLKKRVSEVQVMVYETSHIQVRKNNIVIRKFDIDHFSDPMPKLSENLTISGLLGWDDEQTVSVGQVLPLPMTLLGMAYKVRV